MEQLFITMWNKLLNHCDEILVALMKELEHLKATPTIQKQLEQSDKRIQEQEKQREILNHLASGEMIDSAFCMEQRNMVSKNLKEYQREEEQYLRKFRQRKELIQTKELIKQFKKGPQYPEVYDKILLQAIVKEVIVNPNELVFELTNGLKLTERRK